MEFPALILAFAAMTPLMIYTIWSDLKSLRIPNWVVLATFAVFLVTGFWGLPFETFLWRILHGVIFLMIGFGLYAVASGKVGGGDLKMIAVLVPFIAGEDTLFVLVVYTFVTIAGLFLHRLLRAMLKDRETGWIAIDQKIYFPVGLILGLTILIYLGVELADHFYTAAPEA